MHSCFHKEMNIFDTSCSSLTQFVIFNEKLHPHCGLYYAWVHIRIMCCYSLIENVANTPAFMLSDKQYVVLSYASVHLLDRSKKEWRGKDAWKAVFRVIIR